LAEAVSLPDVALLATDGRYINPRHVKGWAAYFIFPYTGRPGVPDPTGWDGIDGAHGSTPQALAYSTLYEQFLIKDINVFGVSLQDTEWQQEFAVRNRLPYQLLSDDLHKFSNPLCLETFNAGERIFLRRRSMAVFNGVIAYDRRLVTPPESDAAAMLAWFVEKLA